VVTKLSGDAVAEAAGLDGLALVLEVLDFSR
jgi:hypothetical protein